MPNSRAFVIRSIKNGETSLITSCYLEDIGFKTFIVKGVYGSKKSKFSKAHFFPLNIIPGISEMLLIELVTGYWLLVTGSQIIKLLLVLSLVSS